MKSGKDSSLKKYILFFFLPVLLIGLHACDEGRIYEKADVYKRQTSTFAPNKI